MIFFFAGPHKNGTHFQMLVATTALDLLRTPYRFVGDMVLDRTRVFKGDLSSGKAVLDVLASDPQEIQVCKAHWGTPLERDLLLTYPDIRIFLIWRDLRDVLVSSFYYHRTRFPDRFHDFDHFYRKKGRGILLHQVRYQRTWRRFRDDPRVFESRYEDLVSSFATNVPKLLNFARIGPVDLSELEDRLSIEKLRRKYKDQDGFLFRRGTVGEHTGLFQSNEYGQDIERFRRFSDPRLWLESLIDDPRVILKRHFPFPGKRIVVAGARIYHRMLRRD